MRKSVLTLTLTGLLLTSAAWAGPEGGEVVSGSATIVPGSGGLTIQQATDRAILNWSRFNINPGEYVRFLQPSASSAVLNRVTGINPSYLMGELSATGRVFLVNPSGIVFGPNSTVNVGSLFATTMQISNQDFMDGNYVFVPEGSPSFVLNQGNIQTTEGGYVVLMAPMVENQGTIVARLGTVTLASVPQTTVSFDGQGLVHYVLVDQPATDVVMPGDLVSDVIGGLVTSSSTDAAGVELSDGQVRLVGGAGMALNTGHIEGGSVDLQGERVGLMGAGSLEGSVVSVTGEFAYTATDSLIRGDDVVIKANDSASVNGLISISPGGFVETSGGSLTVTQSPELGAGSTWLIDPNNLTITNSGPPNNTTAMNPFTTLGDNARMPPLLIEQALTLGTTVIVQTSTGGANAQAGDITVQDPIVPLSPGPGGQTSTLILQAHHNIYLDADIGGVVPVNLVLQANYQNTTPDGTVRLRAGDVDTMGGTLTISGVNLTQGGARTFDTGGGDVLMQLTGAVTLLGTVQAGAGNVTIQAQGTVRADQVNAGTLTVETTVGNVNLDTQVNRLTVNAPGNVSVTNQGDLVVDGVGAVTAPQAVDLATTGNLTGGATTVPNVNADNLTLVVGGDIDLTTTVQSLNVLSLGNVTIDQTAGDLLLLNVAGDTIVISGPGNLTLRSLSALGPAQLIAGGSILRSASNPGGPNFVAGGDSTLSAGGIIGVLGVPIRVNVDGTLSVIAAGEVNGTSGSLSGQVNPSGTLDVPNSPPGRIYFNGVQVGGPVPPPPPPPDPPPPDPPPPDPVVPVQPDVPVVPDPTPPPVVEEQDPDVPARVDSAVGAGDNQIDQQLDTMTTTSGSPGADSLAPPPAGDPAAQAVTADRTAQVQIGFNSTMSPLEPPQPGDADRFVMAALLQASVNSPTDYLNQLENLDGPMSRTDYGLYLGSVLNQKVNISGPEPVQLDEVLSVLFQLYRIDPGSGGVVARAGELGLLPAGVGGKQEVNRGQIYQILDGAFFNLKLPDGRTLYQSRFDSQPPTVSIASFPVVCDTKSLTLRGTVSPGTTLLQVGYKDSDIVKIEEGGAWSATVPLEPGMNTITVQAHDAAGNITTRKLEVLCTVGGG